MTRCYVIYIIVLLYSYTVQAEMFVLPGKKEVRVTRASSYPYISGDTFRAFCNFIIDETHVPFDPSCVQPGSTIFLKSDYIDHFFTTIHPQITAQYILVTHNSDAGITTSHVKYLDDHKLIAWFGQNALIIHPKLFPIPIGLANRYWPHGNISILKQITSETYEKRYLAYLNCTINTNISERKKVYQLFAQQSFCFVASGCTYEDYLRSVACSCFTFSPPGNGLDCHRTWEALYVGSIPIVKRSLMDAVFDDLPVIIIDDWAQVTKEFLESEYQKMQLKSCNMEKLYADYWFDLIKNLQYEGRR
ncbi:hypothetical protein KC460_03290 [Candidatus Dependentiae bacterium]|nr:hypothetical protein [Candidatus Dependentiae bacterium]